MKKLLALALVAVMAGGAMAQVHGEVGGSMGLFFSDTDFSDATSNKDTAPGDEAFFAYIVMLDCVSTSVGGYEVGITGITDPGGTIFILGVDGPNGWVNFGDNTNHLVGYGVPLPVELDGTAVLATMQILDPIGTVGDFVFGPSDPSSFPDLTVPVFSDGPVATILMTCTLTTGVFNEVGTVATLNGDGIVATESASWTDVKALFD